VRNVKKEALVCIFPLVAVMADQALVNNAWVSGLDNADWSIAQLKNVQTASKNAPLLPVARRPPTASGSTTASASSTRS
jgi:hypothetical protein